MSSISSFLTNDHFNILGKNTYKILKYGRFWIFLISAGICLAETVGIRSWYIMFQGKKWIPNRKANTISPHCNTALCHNCTGLAWLQDSSQKKNQLSTYYYCEKGCRMLGLFFRRLFVLHLRNLNVFEVFRILIIQLKPNYSKK